MQTFEKRVRILGILHGGRGEANHKKISNSEAKFRVYSVSVERKSDLASNCLSAPLGQPVRPSQPILMMNGMHNLLIHQYMHVSYYTHILINATTYAILHYFAPIYFPFAPLYVTLRCFTLLYCI